MSRLRSSVCLLFLRWSKAFIGCCSCGEPLDNAAAQDGSPSGESWRYAGVQGRFSLGSVVTEKHMHHVALFVILFVINFSDCTAIIDKQERKTRFRIYINQRKSHGWIVMVQAKHARWRREQSSTSSAAFCRVFYTRMSDVKTLLH
jgi:hypothetical protein